MLCDITLLLNLTMKIMQVLSVLVLCSYVLGEGDAGKPEMKSTAPGTIKDCLEAGDPYVGITCFLSKLKTDNIDKDTADAGIKHFASKLSVDRFLYAIGFNSNLGLEIGVYNDPSGKYIELHQRYLRYGKTDIGVTHQKPHHKFSIVYPWEDKTEPEPFNHWSSYTALRGEKGYNLAYAHSGKARGIKHQDTFRNDCGGVSDIMKLNTKYYEHVSIFMGANYLCLDKKGDYDIIIGKYEQMSMTHRGREAKTYAPVWECYLDGDLTCYGSPEQAALEKINKMLDTLN